MLGCLGGDNESLSLLELLRMSAQPDYWQKDEEALDCGLCHRKFTFFFRRHHCRNCGDFKRRSVCNTCYNVIRLAPQRAPAAPVAAAAPSPAPRQMLQEPSDVSLVEVQPASALMSPGQELCGFSGVDDRSGAMSASDSRHTPHGRYSSDQVPLDDAASSESSSIPSGQDNEEVESQQGVGEDEEEEAGDCPFDRHTMVTYSNDTENVELASAVRFVGTLFPLKGGETNVELLLEPVVPCPVLSQPMHALLQRIAEKTAVASVVPPTPKARQGSRVAYCETKFNLILSNVFADSDAADYRMTTSGSMNGRDAETANRQKKKSVYYQKVLTNANFIVG
eukprot:gene10074-7044_t